MSTVSVPSIEAFLAAVEAAEQRLVSGEAKARHAKALLLQAEKARDEAAARKAEAQQQLAPIEEALNKARALRALVGEVVISQGEALLEQTWAEAQAEVTRLQTEAEAAQAEVERLMAAPEVQAYLDYREAQERAHREVRERERRELEVRLAALRPGAAVGQGTGPLAELAAQARKTGFPNLAAQAQDAAEAARQVAKAQAQAEKALRKRRLIRWAER
jgi:chromosome segregation protein